MTRLCASQVDVIYPRSSSQIGGQVDWKVNGESDAEGSTMMKIIFGRQAREGSLGDAVHVRVLEDSRRRTNALTARLHWTLYIVYSRLLFNWSSKSKFPRECVYLDVIRLHSGYSELGFREGQQQWLAEGYKRIVVSISRFNVVAQIFFR